MAVEHWSKAEGGEWACAEYAARRHRAMLEGPSEDHSSLLITIRTLERHGLIEVEGGFWCRPNASGKFVYQVSRRGGSIDIQVVDSAKLKRNTRIDWRRVPKGRLEHWPPPGI